VLVFGLEIALTR